MKVSYKGIKSGLPANLQDKLDAKFARLSKLVDGRGEKQAHVVVTSERHLHKAEITLRIHNHQLVGIGSDSDVFKAMSAALDRIEKQAAKEGAKWRETTRRSDSIKVVGAKDAQPDASKPSARGKIAPRKVVAGNNGQGRRTAASSDARVFRTDHHERSKPITLEEALLQMEDGRDYVAYRDADKQVVCMLIRRRDGHYDLIET
ncbi:MAG TPA: ribosome-associated translation inhibitor RaiA [Bryobacteraceae bacterium]|nr:ribosome-associated translation inhibitor RaiA [Bryobacteraceae bacterium]